MGCCCWLADCYTMKMWMKMVMMRLLTCQSTSKTIVFLVRCWHAIHRHRQSRRQIDMYECIAWRWSACFCVPAVVSPKICSVRRDEFDFTSLRFCLIRVDRISNIFPIDLILSQFSGPRYQMNTKHILCKSTALSEIWTIFKRFIS